MRTRALERAERGGAALPRPTPAQPLRPLPMYSLKRALDWGLRGGLFGAGAGNEQPAPARARRRRRRLHPDHHAAGPRAAAAAAAPPAAGRVVAQLARASGARSLFAGAVARAAHGAWHTLFVFTVLHPATEEG